MTSKLSVRGLTVGSHLSARLVRVALLNGVLLNSLLSILAVIALRFNLLQRGYMGTGFAAIFLHLLRGHQADDSWAPMLHALDCFRDKLPIYQTLFFDLGNKFQYPLTSLLPMYLLRLIGWSDSGILVLLNAATWIAFWVTIGISIRILIVSTRKNGDSAELSGDRLKLAVAAAFVCGLTFFPLLKNYLLGQAQTFISVLFAGAVYLWLNRRYKSAGFCFGLMCLVKPQYAVFLLWFALRKRFGALVASASVILAGTAVGGVVFGWREQFEYIRVLQYIGRRGESFWVNESFNGFFNRLLFNGPNLEWMPRSFAPYLPLVYGITLVTSAVLLLVALFFPYAARLRAGVLDLCVMGVTATVISPVAWDHHYGILLPIYGYLAATTRQARQRSCLLVSYILTSNSWSPMNVFAHVPALNALQSLRFFGVLLLLYFLYSTSRDRKLRIASPAETPRRTDRQRALVLAPMSQATGSVRENSRILEHCS